MKLAKRKLIVDGSHIGYYYLLGKKWVMNPYNSITNTAIKTEAQKIAWRST